MSLTDAGIIGIGTPASEPGAMPESVQELGSNFNHGSDDVSRLRLNLGESELDIQLGLISPPRVGVKAELLGDVPSTCTPLKSSSTMEKVLFAVTLRASKGPVTERSCGETTSVKASEVFKPELKTS